MSDPRYPILLKILDQIRRSAPSTPEFSRFYSNKKEDVEWSRSQAYIHLLLLVRFGIEDFHKRDEFICDGPFDGGVDAIYIDKDDHIIYFVQSKFRHSPENFASTRMGIGDLIKMEIKSIVQGKLADSNGNPFNEKVKNLQALVAQANREGIYEYKVLFLAHFEHTIKDPQVRIFTDSMDYEIYDFERSYNDLVRPVCAGTYYNSGTAKRPIVFSMELNLKDKRQPYAHQVATTSFGNSEIYVLYVPTREIGRMMSKYKNAVLRYNPRNFLGVGDKENSVNRKIQASILSVSQNDFALLNNGITILADDAKVQPDTGEYNLGLLKLTNPQIVNGGQTAYTLGVLYDNKFPENPAIFDGKEVLLRVVKFPNVESEISADGMSNHQLLIRSLSNSTNQQTAIVEADRRSNDYTFQQIQNLIFEKYGYLLKVKQGEFYNGIENGFVEKGILLDRDKALRSLIAFRFLHPTLARNGSAPKLFSEKEFNAILKHKDEDELQDIASQIFFARMIQSKLPKVGRNKQSLIQKYGYALIYGKYAVIAAISHSMNPGLKNNLSKQTSVKLAEISEREIDRILKQWKKFEKFAKTERRQENSEYFSGASLDHDNYYKGTTLGKDIKDFGWK